VWTTAAQGAAVAVFVVPEEEDAELVLDVLDVELELDVASDEPEPFELFASLDELPPLVLAAVVVADFESERASLR
jgi:hypothetical protein